MERRSFLTRLASGLIGAAFVDIDPEKLLWVPGAKTTFDLGRMSGEPLNQWVREALVVLERNLKFHREVNRTYDEAWVGNTINVRIPTRYRIGQAL